MRLLRALRQRWAARHAHFGTKYRYSYADKRKLTDGSVCTVSVSSDSLIDPDEWFVLRPDVQREMAEQLMTMANSMEPPAEAN